jgi:fluoride ion exporter CrcB/FEX
LGRNRWSDRHGRTRLSIRAVARLIGETFLCGTLIINVTGCFAIGFFATLTGSNCRYYVGSMGDSSS